MKRTAPRVLSLLLALLLAGLALSGCEQKPVKPLAGTDDNDILTFTNNEANRPVIRIGMQYYTPDTNLLDALEAKFPEYLFVLDYRIASGTNSEVRLNHMLQKSEPLDLIISGTNFNEPQYAEFCVDLSAESFVNNYLLSALNNVSLDGKLYCLPGVSTMAGIAFNARMFREHGWEIPRDQEEFFALCAKIQEAGIEPISACFKYTSAVVRLLGTMCYDQLYLTAESLQWLQDLQENKATFAGHMEPFYELGKRFADMGMIGVDSFTASLTKQRQAFWAGESAMIDYDSAIFSYIESEAPDFELGIMPYPAKDAERSGFSVTPSYYLSLPKTLEKNPERLAMMKEILAFMSSVEGQEAMLRDSIRLSNVRGITLSTDENPAFAYIQEAYDRGNLYPQVTLRNTNIGFFSMQQQTVKSLFEGGSVEDAIAEMDRLIAEGFTNYTPVEETYETIAKAEADFSMLETSYYLADKLREAAGADIGLMVNGGYFRSNHAMIDAGDITSDLSRYVMKGVGAEDFLMTYRMTGKQIKELIEHPIINGSEQDSLIAASGLKMEFAPWNERGSRILKVTREDGKALEDDTLYTVAAWKGVVDEKYVTETVESLDSLGTLTDILDAAFRKDGTIKPELAKWLKLIWPEAKAK